MRITRNIPAQLIVEHKPLGPLAIAAVGAFICSVMWSGRMFQGSQDAYYWLAAAGACAVAMLFFARRRQTMFLRDEGQVVLRLRTVFGHTEEVRPLSDALMTIVEERMNQDMELKMRLLLLWREGSGFEPYPLALDFETPVGHKEEAAEINAWLDAATRHG
ncbi:hypothetical protein C8N43_3233 [Litoreibacter ponti]|uniref:PH (Pleckstrin Homology) domain-containing protein n=1 Tax=Litoreibacter ponti TaxID=1510457 RepID=A0A2T6BED0_9RHOB|nr:hypothetical protein [Litoreibacter ponti]PTX54419.1 hypothetical protein C8N43_3233 [Litoreibacter ponti]